jgi:multiple sugar transport system substrate-binding protein
MLITESCENKEAAWKFIEYITANKEAQMIAWKAMDSFPSLVECWSDPFADEPVPFFGGQAYRKVFVEAAKCIPWWNYSKDFSEMNTIMQTHVTAYALGKTESAEEALTQLAEEIKARTGRK